LQQIESTTGADAIVLTIDSTEVSIVDSKLKTMKSFVQFGVRRLVKPAVTPVAIMQVARNNAAVVAFNNTKDHWQNQVNRNFQVLHNCNIFIIFI